MTRPGPGLVYYVGDATRFGLRVKVGFTTNLATRLPSLAQQTISRTAPIVLALAAGSYELERSLHEKYAESWLVGEWFKYGDGIAVDLGEMEEPVSYLAARTHLWRFAGGWQGFKGWSPESVPPGVRIAQNLSAPDLDPDEPIDIGQDLTFDQVVEF